MPERQRCPGWSRQLPNRRLPQVRTLLLNQARSQRPSLLLSPLPNQRRFPSSKRSWCRKQLQSRPHLQRSSWRIPWRSWPAVFCGSRSTCQTQPPGRSNKNLPGRHGSSSCGPCSGAADQAAAERRRRVRPAGISGSGSGLAATAFSTTGLSTTAVAAAGAALVRTGAGVLRTWPPP